MTNLKLTPVWRELVTRPFNENLKRLGSEIQEFSYSDAQMELANYLIKSGVNDSESRVRDYLNGQIRLGAFDKAECNFPIDWRADPFNNRTWQWLHHQLAVLGDMSYLMVTKKQNFLVDSASSYIDSWIEHNFVKDLPSEFSWGDHSTAHRLKNLVNFLLAARHVISYTKLKKYLALVEVHCRVLSSSKFYNKHTNHGLDQLLYLLVAACYFPQMKSAERFKKIAMSRLEDEISYGFAGDGVHTENSPQYHFILLNRLAILHSLQKSFSIPSDISLSDLFQKAIKFARFIKRPDGLIPIIGDSELKPAFLSPLFKSEQGYEEFASDSNLRAIESHIFEQSGYYTYRHKLTEDRKDDLHFVVKCGYLSNYHRQDDDGSFVLTAYGEDWFVDGGLYKHKNDDPIREYLRSVNAHNTILVRGENIIRTKNCDSVASKLAIIKSSQDEVVLKAQIHMYKSFALDRGFHLDSEAIKISSMLAKEDSAKSEELASVILFHIPVDKEIFIKENEVVLKSKESDRQMKLAFTSSEFSDVFVMEEGSHNCFSSSKVNSLSRVQTLAFNTKSLVNKNSIAIKFQSNKK